MIFIPVVMVLAAAPVHVVAVHGPGDSRAVRHLSAISGVTTIDASSLHEYLLRPMSMMGMQDFDAFTAAPVKGWPPALGDVWTKGLARWAPAGATGPAQPRTLSFASHVETSDAMGSMTVVTTMLACGPNTVATEVAQSPMVKRSPVDVVSERLTQVLAAKFCR